jgi:hypothetical protein
MIETAITCLVVAIILQVYSHFATDGEWVRVFALVFYMLAILFAAISKGVFL